MNGRAFNFEGVTKSEVKRGVRSRTATTDPYVTFNVKNQTIFLNGPIVKKMTKNGYDRVRLLFDREQSVVGFDFFRNPKDDQHWVFNPTTQSGETILCGTFLKKFDINSILIGLKKYKFKAVMQYPNFVYVDLVK